MRYRRAFVIMTAFSLFTAGAYADSIWKTCSDRGQADRRLIPTDVPTNAQLSVMKSMMSHHSHRLAHVLWHIMRGNISADDQAVILQSYGDKWNNPHATCPLPKSTVGPDYNAFGEDFLFMHRGMIEMMQRSLIDARLPCIAGWAALPAADDRKWPVPDNNNQGAKSTQAYSMMKDWAAAFSDPGWLKIHSLAQLGFMMEVTLHNNMHMRWATSSPPPGFSSGASIPLNNQFPSDWPYDDKKYDWLADPYGAHVNKHFWKLHGLIDQILDKWLDANGYQSIAENCNGDATCYEWKGTWVGEPMMMSEARGAEDAGTISSAGAFRAGLLTDEVLSEESFGHATSQWPNDPEDYVNRRFCLGN